MKTRKRNFKKNGETQNFWPSFADVMSTIVLVFFFIILLAYIHNIVTSNKLESNRTRLVALEDDLNAKEKILEESRVQINIAEEQLRLIEQEVEKTRAEVEQGKRDLTLSHIEIEKQRQIIAESNRELGNLRTKLQDIAVLRVNVLNNVKESIENVLGRTNDNGEALVTIGPNANLVINESLVFDTGSSVIKPQGQALLNQFAIAFENLLDDASIRQNIDSINIEGHADIVGDSKYNRELSSERAYTVLNYMMTSNYTLENKYGSYFAATGYSEFRPIDPGTSEESLQKNRRIEISISIKDSNIQNIINDYLKETDKLLDTDQDGAL